MTDPRVDHQAIREASYVNIPVIAFCDTDAPLKFVDVAIPINNKARNSVGLAWWLLAREVLRLRGTIPRTSDGWNVMVDMFFYRDPEEVEKQQQEEAAAKAAAVAGEQAEAPVGEWDVTSAPAAGGINPTLVAGEGAYMHALKFSAALIIDFRRPRLVCGACCWWSFRLVSRARCGGMGCGACCWLGRLGLKGRGAATCALLPPPVAVWQSCVVVLGSLCLPRHAHFHTFLLTQNHVQRMTNTTCLLLLPSIPLVVSVINVSTIATPELSSGRRLDLSERWGDLQVHEKIF